MSDRVIVEIEVGVAEVRLNRPEKLNALDMAMFDGLVETGRKLQHDRTVRAVVLCGEGRAFCAGLDFTSLMSLASKNESTHNLLDREEGASANYAQMAAPIWTEIPVPVIAAVHGVVFGGGLQIALAADIRLLAPDAQLSVMEIKWGLIPDMTGPETLRHLVRLDVAKELTFTGRIVSGKEAVELGLGTRLSNNPRQDARALAREIAGKSPDAIRAGKRLLNATRLVPLSDGLKMEEAAQLALIGRPNQIEAVRANLEKREPQFNDPDPD